MSKILLIRRLSKIKKNTTESVIFWESKYLDTKARYCSNKIIPVMSS